MKFTQYVLSFDIRKIEINFACFNSMLLGAFKRVFVSNISYALSHSPSRMPGRGEGILPMMAYTGRLPQKGYLFQAFGVRKGRDFTS